MSLYVYKMFALSNLETRGSMCRFLHECERVCVCVDPTWLVAVAVAICCWCIFISFLSVSLFLMRQTYFHLVMQISCSLCRVAIIHSVILLGKL